MTASRLPALSGASAQLGLTLAAMAGVLVWPPADGAMLVIPVDGRAPGPAINLALDAGAKLLGAGPLPGSVVIRGARARLWRPLAAQGYLVLAAPDRGCGA